MDASSDPSKGKSSKKDYHSRKRAKWLRGATIRALLWLRSAPISQFYLYMWKSNKRLLASSIFTNYIFPLITELLPWYLCVRRISKEMRATRTGIEHSLFSGSPLNSNRIASYVGMTIMYSIMHNMFLVLQNRNELESQLMVRRLVMERILFSEIGAVERRYEQVFGEVVRAENIEEHIFHDINETVVLFNVTIPGIIRGIAELLRETYDLYGQRQKIDLVALARPFVMNTILEGINLVRWHFIGENQEMLRIRNRLKMSKAISNICEGLSDVQVNNMQAYQLRILDDLINKEVENKEGWIKYLNTVYETVDNRSLVDFVTETYLAHWVMRTRGITHETFTNIRNEILHVVMSTSRVWKQCKRAALVMDSQHRVVQLMELDMFSSEKKVDAIKKKKPEPFRRITIRSVYFNYAKDGRLLVEEDRDDSDDDVKAEASAYNEDGEKKHRGDELKIGPEAPSWAPITLKKGGTYLIVGRNRSGKSTLVKVLCKILKPHTQDISFNGKAFENVERVHLRQMISYVAQRPFIFEGTIAENISLGKVPLDSEKLEFAAEQAGVFITKAPVRLKDTRELAMARRRKMAAKPWTRRPPLLQWFYKEAFNTLTWGSRTVRNFLNSDPIAAPSEDDPAFAPCLAADTSDTLRGIMFDCPASPIAPQLRSPLRAASPIGQTPVEELMGVDKKEILKTHTNSRGTNLSGGFAQSVALARVFLRPEAQIVILDEAIGQMDAIKRNEHVLPRLFQFVREHGMTLIIISHDVQNVCRKVDRVFVMDNGQCVHQGPHHDLVKAGATEYLKLLGESADSKVEFNLDVSKIADDLKQRVR